MVSGTKRRTLWLPSRLSLVTRRGAFKRKRVIVINAYFDDLRRNGGRPLSVPQAVGPTYLAGAFSPEKCELQLYNEQYSGPLEDEKLFAWPDMIVLTGLTVAFDRMRQLAAYARTKNRRVIVVAGGPAVRALPRLARKYFDYACIGDIEELLEVVADAFGTEYVAKEMFPRFDLTYWFGRLAYLETSRNCNFKCSFCSLTGERTTYQRYELDYIKRQIIALGTQKLIIFADNNFYGNDRRFFIDRLSLLRELWHDRQFGNWVALVSSDFL